MSSIVHDGDGERQSGAELLLECFMTRRTAAAAPKVSATHRYTTPERHNVCTTNVSSVDAIETFTCILAEEHQPEELTCGCAGLLSATASRRASSSLSLEGEAGPPRPLASPPASLGRPKDTELSTEEALYSLRCKLLPSIVSRAVRPDHVTQVKSLLAPDCVRQVWQSARGLCVMGPPSRDASCDAITLVYPK